jgi:hypothetical protein
MSKLRSHLYACRLRDELRDGEIFYSLREARIVIEQHDQAARLTWIQATSTAGVRARLRRVAGCATPSGSAGHAGETDNLKLTFHLDHSAGADQWLSDGFGARLLTWLGTVLTAAGDALASGILACVGFVLGGFLAFRIQGTIE